MNYQPLKLSRWTLIATFLNRRVERFLKRAGKRHYQSACYPLAVFAFDHIGYKVMTRGVYEREHLDAVFKYLADEKKIVGAALDIGANIGNHAIYFARHFEKVVCFEAHPATFQLLKFNTRAFSHIACHEVGVSDHAGTAFIEVLNRDNIGMSKVSHDVASRIKERYPITLSPIDGVYDGVGKVGLIKMDVEGAEPEVLRGCMNLLKRDMPVILFEQGKNEFADGTSETIALLRGVGYRDFKSVEMAPRVDLGLGRAVDRCIQYLVAFIAGPRMTLTRENVFRRRRYAMIMAER